MNVITKTLYTLKNSPLYPLLTALPYAPYRGAVLRYIDEGHLSILEAGCGAGNLIRSPYFPKEMPLKVGLEIFRPYVDRAHQRGFYDLTVQGDVRSLPFADNSIDCVICVEVIEHMPKDQGFALIGELERIARKQLIISTTDLPLQEIDPARAADGNLYMYHQARWKPQDFREKGFEVYGMYPRFTEGSPYDPIYFLSYVLPLMWLVKHSPERAKAFTAVKRF